MPAGDLHLAIKQRSLFKYTEFVEDSDGKLPVQCIMKAWFGLNFKFALNHSKAFKLHLFENSQCALKN